MMLKKYEFLAMAYALFNARNIEAALTMLHPDVVWPNGMEGGYVHGHEGVRDYWTRQWSVIDPHVEPSHFETDEAGRILVDVHQVIRDLTGGVIADQHVRHIYVIEDDLIRNMEIRKT